MTTSRYLTIAGVLALVFGILPLLFPNVLLQGYNLPPELVDSPYYRNLFRIFGAANLGMGIVALLIRNWEFQLVRPALIGLAVSCTCAFASYLFHQFATESAVPRTWINVLIYLGLAVGAIYCLAAGAKARQLATPELKA